MVEKQTIPFFSVRQINQDAQEEVAAKLRESSAEEQAQAQILWFHYALQERGSISITPLLLGSHLLVEVKVLEHDRESGLTCCLAETARECLSGQTFNQARDLALSEALDLAGFSVNRLTAKANESAAELSATTELITTEPVDEPRDESTAELTSVQTITEESVAEPPARTEASDIAAEATPPTDNELPAMEEAVEENATNSDFGELSAQPSTACGQTRLENTAKDFKEDNASPVQQEEIVCEPEIVATPLAIFEDDVDSPAEEDVRLKYEGMPFEEIVINMTLAEAMAVRFRVGSYSGQTLREVLSPKDIDPNPAETLVQIMEKFRYMKEEYKGSDILARAACAVVFDHRITAAQKIA